jgi:Protein of unknown function (DUF2752)
MSEASRASRGLAAMLFVACLALLSLGEGSVAAARSAQGIAGLPTAQVCSFRARTGAPCLGCGGTEAFGHAARGRFVSAVVANPLGAWAGATAWALLFSSGLTLAGGRTRPLRLALLSAAATLPAAFIVNVFAWWASLPPGAMPGR